MKAKEIKVAAWYEEKVNTGNYSNFTVGSSFEILSSIEEGESPMEKYDKIYKSIQEKIKIDVEEKIQTYLDQIKGRA